MLTVTDLELATGGRTLLSGATFHVRAGDRIGLVGRNGAGKTTLARVLAGETLPAAGSVKKSAPVAYLPQDPRTGDLSATVRHRVLEARGLERITEELAELATAMAHEKGAARESVLRRYSRAEERFVSLGGWAAEAEAEAILQNLGLPTRIWLEPLANLSGGQRRRVELARVLFSGAETLLLDEPTNHLDADSISWLRSFLRAHEGGVVVISHDTTLIEAVVNRVFYLDATSAQLEIYNLPWRLYLTERQKEEQRRTRERANAERKVSALRSQADKMRASATKARAAHQLDRRAERLVAELPGERRKERVARLRLPTPAPCGRVPLKAIGLARNYGSLEVFNGLDLAVDRGARVVVLGLNGAGKTTLLRILAGLDSPDAGEVELGYGARVGYYAQEHETLDPEASVFQNLRRAVGADVTDTALRSVLGAFLFSGDRVDQLAGTLSGGEKTRLCLALLVVSNANVLLLDEPTNNLDPASRQEVLAALGSYAGAIVLVTHDPGAVEALSPERVVIMPDGTEDLWSAELADLVALA